MYPGKQKTGRAHKCLRNGKGSELRGGDRCRARETKEQSHRGLGQDPQEKDGKRKPAPLDNTHAQKPERGTGRERQQVRRGDG